MKAINQLICTILLLFVSATLHAQEDTAFINNYKRFRTLVDPLSTYTIYMVPYQSTDKHPINEVHPYIKETYHFLRTKKVNRKKPQFIIGVLIDSLNIDYPQTTLHTSSKESELHTVQTNYQLNFTILVHNSKGETLQFTLGSRQAYAKEGRVGVWKALKVSGADGHYRITDLQEAIKRDAPRLQPNIEDFKKNFLDLLLHYKNYYIDRVDQ